jgi:hypothetical protein
MDFKFSINIFSSIPDHFNYDLPGIWKLLKYKLQNWNKSFEFTHNGKKYYGSHLPFIYSFCNCFCEGQKIFKIKYLGTLNICTNLIFDFNICEKITFKKKEKWILSFLTAKDYSISSLDHNENLSLQKINQAKYIFYKNATPVATYLINAISLSSVTIDVQIEKPTDLENDDSIDRQLVFIYGFGVYLLGCSYSELYEKTSTIS